MLPSRRRRGRPPRGRPCPPVATGVVPLQVGVAVMRLCRRHTRLTKLDSRGPGRRLRDRGRPAGAGQWSRDATGAALPAMSQTKSPFARSPLARGQPDPCHRPSSASRPPPSSTRGCPRLGPVGGHVGPAIDEATRLTTSATRPRGRTVRRDEDRRERAQGHPPDRHRGLDFANPPFVSSTNVLAQEGLAGHVSSTGWGPHTARRCGSPRPRGSVSGCAQPGRPQASRPGTRAADTADHWRIRQAEQAVKPGGSPPIMRE
jgi:hypothetical protein